VRYKRSTARVILHIAATIGMLCGVIVFSQNILGIDMSSAPLHGPFSIEGHLARLRFTVGLGGLGLLTMGTGIVAYLRSRDDRAESV